MGYGLIPVIASVVLGIHHVMLTDASRASKGAVAVTVVAALAIGRLYPRGILLAQLLQVGVCVYLLLLLRIRES